MEGRARARLTKAEGRKFAFSVGLAFFALASLMVWRGLRTLASVFAGIAILLILAGGVTPTRLGPIYRSWMGLALAISRVTTPIFMGIVYYVVLTPTGAVMRLLGKDSLRREPEEDTYWISRIGPGRGVSDMNRQF